MAGSSALVKESMRQKLFENPSISIGEMRLALHSKNMTLDERYFYAMQSALKKKYGVQSIDDLPRINGKLQAVSAARLYLQSRPATSFTQLNRVLTTDGADPISSDEYEELVAGLPKKQNRKHSKKQQVVKSIAAIPAVPATSAIASSSKDLLSKQLATLEDCLDDTLRQARDSKDNALIGQVKNLRRFISKYF